MFAQLATTILQGIRAVDDAARDLARRREDGDAGRLSGIGPESSIDVSDHGEMTESSVQPHRRTVPGNTPTNTEPHPSEQRKGTSR